MIIMFMISASSALCTLAALYFALTTLCDTHHRIRPERMTSAKPALYAYRDALFAKIWQGVKHYAGGNSSRPAGEEGNALLR